MYLPLGNRLLFLTQDLKIHDFEPFARADSFFLWAKNYVLVIIAHRADSNIINMSWTTKKLVKSKSVKIKMWRRMEIVSERRNKMVV